MLEEATLPRRRSADRRSDLTKEEFTHTYAMPGIPVVLEGAARSWPAMRKWNQEFFRRTYGDLEVTVMRPRQAGERKRLPLADYLSYMMTAEDDPYYLANWIFGESCPALLEDFENPPLFDRWEQQLPAHLRPKWQWLFLGPMGSGSPLHVDTLHSSAWNAVITGRKRWLFYSPDASGSVYQGRVDAFHPDLQTFPRFARAEAIECIQYPGDIVFTPSGWWHQVYNEEPGISVTENFINASNYDNVLIAMTIGDRTELARAMERIGAQQRAD